MIDIKVRYQASIFTSSIEASPANISSLMALFADRGFVPTTYQEFPIVNPMGIAVNLIPQLRFNLKTNGDEWVVSFNTGRIDVVKNMTDAKGKNLGDISQFSSEVNDIFRKILERYPMKANRIALSSNFILNKMPSDTLDGVYSKLINPTETYTLEPPVEWNVRSVSRIIKVINYSEELFNFCTEVNRFSGQINNKIDQSIVPLDRIAITLDINSVSTDTRERFDTVSVADFYGRVPEWHNEILNELIEKIK